MTHIPTKAELDDARNSASTPNVADEVKKFTDDIVAAMQKNQSYLPVQFRMPSAAAEAQLKSKFQDQGWTLSFKPARTGGSIHWS